MNSKLDFTVFDILGKKVLCGKYDAVYGRNNIKVNLTDYTEGLYILKVFENTKMIYSQKLIKN